MKLSIIVPACNEEKRIGDMLDAYVPFFTRKYGEDAEFLVVVNGSTDATDQVVRSYIPDNPRIRCIVEPDRIGKGGAVIRGFREAAGDLVGFADADGSTPPEAFQDLVDNMGESDAIIASRWRKGAVVSPRQPLLRRTSSRVFNTLTRLLFGLRLTDTQCGAKLFRRDSIRAVLPSLGITCWAFDVDLLFQLRRAGRAISEIPTQWHDVVGSKIEVASASAEMLAALVRLRMLYSPLKWIVSFYDKTVGPFMHPPGFAQDRLFRHSFLLMSGAQFVNVGSMLFQVCMVRMLSKNGDAPYGEMYAMLSMYMVITMPFGALGRTMSHFTSNLVAEGRSGAVRDLTRQVFKVVVIAVAVMCIGAFVAKDHLASFFRLSSPAIVLIMAAAVPAALCQVIITGVMGGYQAFVWCLGVGVVWSVLRFAVGTSLVAAGGGAASGLSAHAVAMWLSLALSAYGLRQVIGKRKQTGGRESFHGLYRCLLRCVFALSGIAILMSADAALVKHYFDPETAGLFSKGAMVAHMVIFLPLPLTGALFSRLVSSVRPSGSAARTLARAVLLVSVIVAVGVLLCAAFTRLILGILAGDVSPELVGITRGMVLAFAPLSIVFVLMHFELAQRRFAISIPLVVCAMVYLGGVALRHDSLADVVLIMGISNTLALALSLACLPWRSFLKKPGATSLEDSFADAG